MEYKYKDLTYNKRPLTDDIALVVVTNDLVSPGEQYFTKLVYPYKAGELAAQVDSCPVADLSRLRTLVDYLKKKIDGFRIRHAQLSGIIAYDGIYKADEETAEFLIASGSIAVIAGGYEGGTDELLLKNGVLPLISDEHFEKDDFILIRGIGSGVADGSFLSYKVFPVHTEQVNISIKKYSKNDIKFITE